MSLVILIDHEKPICEALGQVLTRHGLETKQYFAPQGCIEEQLWRSANAIVSDIGFEALDGIECGLALRKAGCRLPIIFATGLLDVRVDHCREKLEPFLILQKPFKVSDLISLLGLALRGRIDSSLGDIGYAGGEFLQIFPGDLTGLDSVPVDLFAKLDFEGRRMLQVAKKGGLLRDAPSIKEHSDGKLSLYAKRPHWRRFLITMQHHEKIGLDSCPAAIRDRAS